MRIQYIYKNIAAACGVFLLFFFFSACGYRFAGGGSFPEGIKTIYVSTLENRTSETGIENIFTNDIIYEFTRCNQAALTDKEKADAVLDGVVQSMNLYTVSRRGSHSSVERRVRITLSLRLNNQNGRPIWSAKDITDDEAYQVTSDKLATEQNRRNAIETLSKRLAEKIFHRLTEDF